MKDRSDSSDRRPEERALARFLEAHPRGDQAAFDAWAEEDDVLRADADLAARTRELFLRWKRTADLLGDGTHSTRRKTDGSFFRALAGEREATPAETRAAGLQPGQRIGHFTLRRFIASGGMGQVWEAHDETLRTEVALKLILPGRVDARSLDLFAREARAGGRLRHPYIVTTLSTGRADGLTWIAQELVDGSWTVKDLLDQLRAEDRVPRDHYKLVALFVARIADGLQAAHDAGVIHRDVKPANILIAPDDTPRLTDFGLARVVDDSFLSQSGDLAGTWSYMSPEQVTAKRMGLDHRTDIFSLGVVLYELLTLRRPFEGDTTHQIAEQIITHEPPQPSKIRSQCPRELAIICGKALEKAPSRRYASMREFSADLHRHLNNEPIHARPAGVAVRVGKWVRRHPVRAIGTLSLGVMAVLGLELLQSIEEGRKLKRLLPYPVAIGLASGADKIWPSTPASVEELDGWLGYKSWVDERRGMALAGLETFAELGPIVSVDGGSAPFGDGLQELRDLLKSLDNLEPWVRERLAIAQSVVEFEASASERAAWEAASAAIAGSKHYGGLVLPPQVGLSPLREDPRSGLWEFWHVLSGERPVLDPETDAWRIAPETGMVMVLIPGGRAQLGTPILPPEHELYDFVVEAYDVNISGKALTHEVDLEPFFLSKYELTQGQWGRAMRTNPSLGTALGATHPVETVIWFDALAVAERFDLTLPTEAQWEWAARGGTRTRFFTGQDPNSMRGYAMLLPDANNDYFADIGEDGEYERVWGVAWNNHTLAVGELKPNPFGLHDVLGNVWEWALDDFSAEAPPRAGDGLRTTGPADARKRVMRGGSYASHWTNARVVMRKPWERQNTEPDVGLRPARAVVLAESR